VELIRVSRQMRNLQNMKHFGAVYGDKSSPGSLTIFCPSCPQPGINLPPDWMELPNWVTRRTITVDGNFHADHIKMRRPDLDVALSNGQGFMPEDSRYMEYLKVVQEPNFVSGFRYLAFIADLACQTRDLHVATIGQSRQPTQTLGET